MSDKKPIKKAKRITYGIAYVEYLACRDDVINFFKLGYPIGYIYSDFKEKEIITMSYSSFYKYVRKDEIQVKKERLEEKNTSISNKNLNINANETAEKNTVQADLTATNSAENTNEAEDKFVKSFKELQKQSSKNNSQEEIITKKYKDEELI